MSSKCGSTPSFPVFSGDFHSFHPILGIFIQTNTGNTSTNRHRQLFWKYTRLAIQESRSRLGPEWDRSQHRKTGFSPKDLDGSSTCIENPHRVFPFKIFKKHFRKPGGLWFRCHHKVGLRRHGAVEYFGQKLMGKFRAGSPLWLWALFHWEKNPWVSLWNAKFSMNSHGFSVFLWQKIWSLCAPANRMWWKLPDLESLHPQRMCTETMTLPDPEARPQPWERENFSWKTSVCGSVFSVRCWKSMPRRTKQGGSFGGRRPIFRPVNEDQPEKNRPLIFCRYLWKILEVWLNVSSWIQVDVTKKKSQGRLRKSETLRKSQSSALKSRIHCLCTPFFFSPGPVPWPWPNHASPCPCYERRQPIWEGADRCRVGLVFLSNLPSGYLT